MVIFQRAAILNLSLMRLKLTIFEILQPSLYYQIKKYKLWLGKKFEKRFCFRIFRLRLSHTSMKTRLSARRHVEGSIHTQLRRRWRSILYANCLLKISDRMSAEFLSLS